MYCNPALGARAGNGSRELENRLRWSWYVAGAVQMAPAIARCVLGADWLPQSQMGAI